MSYTFENDLKKVIASCGNDVDVAEIDENTDVVRDFHFDSINIIQLVVELENQFDIEIEDEFLLLDKLSPYKSLVEILSSKTGQRGENGEVL